MAVIEAPVTWNDRGAGLGRPVCFKANWAMHRPGYRQGEPDTRDSP